MAQGAQKRAVTSYRARLTQRGIRRVEVMALDADRDLIRSLARRLAEDGPEAEHARRTLRAVVGGDSPKTGTILEALLRSPLVDAELDLSRPRSKGRKVRL